VGSPFTTELTARLSLALRNLGFAAGGYGGGAAGRLASGNLGRNRLFGSFFFGGYVAGLCKRVFFSSITRSAGSYGMRAVDGEVSLGSTDGRTILVIRDPENLE
jgi:hypothetical protein